MTKLQAHRGVSSDYPENTMIAFRAAVNEGYSIIELDPKYTADGEFVMLHDHSLKRTARDKNGNAPDALIRDVTLAQAREYEYGSWMDESFRGETIPTLAEVLDFSEENPTVPLKFDNVWTTFPDELRAAFLAQIRERGERVSVGLTCGTLESLKQAANTLPRAALHYDGGDLSEDTLDAVSRIAEGHELIIWICHDNPRTSWFKGEKATPELCDRVRKHAKIGIWLINKPDEFCEAENVLHADYVETNGQLKPSRT